MIDAHVHFWDPERLNYEWLAELPSLRRRYTPNELPPTRHAVTGWVFVQADCREDETWAEIDWVSELARQHPIRGIVAYAGVHAGDGVRDQIERLAAHPLVVGVRRLLQGSPDALVRSPALTEGVALLHEFGLAFDACVTHAQLPALTDLVGRCDGVTFVLDHLCKPDVAAGVLDPWRADLARLAERPNVACKLSGLATEADHRTWTPEGLRPYLEHALACFGPERCLVGSDWPVATLATSYERWFDVLLEFLADLPRPAREAILAGNASRVYGLAD
jgi:L-fuconolactonase